MTTEKVAVAAIPGDWTSRAACKGRTDLFYAPAGERPERAVLRIAQARELCFACPVRVDCRTYARAHREYGIWGGETEADRAALGFAPPTPAGNVASAARAYRKAAGS